MPQFQTEEEEVMQLQERVSEAQRMAAQVNIPSFLIGKTITLNTQIVSLILIFILATMEILSAKPLTSHAVMIAKFHHLSGLIKAIDTLYMSSNSSSMTR